MNKPRSIAAEVLDTLLDSRVGILMAIMIVSGQFIIKLDDEQPGEYNLEWLLSWLVTLLTLMVLSRLWVLFFLRQSIIALWLTTLVLIPAGIEVSPAFYHTFLG